MLSARVTSTLTGTIACHFPSVPNFRAGNLLFCEKVTLEYVLAGNGIFCFSVFLISFAILSFDFDPRLLFCLSSTSQNVLRTSNSEYCFASSCSKVDLSLRNLVVCLNQNYGYHILKTERVRFLTRNLSITVYCSSHYTHGDDWLFLTTHKPLSSFLIGQFRSKIRSHKNLHPNLSEL